jgi:GNAT superfamily N-acetyltransferase
MIRKATSADTPALCELIRGLAEYEQLGDKLDLHEDRLQAHLFGPQPVAEVLLAEDAGAVVGFALYFPVFSTFQCKPGIYLEDLFVMPEHRGKGHGRALLVALARMAVERGCGHLEWTVLKWNEQAIGFYRSLGAFAMDQWCNYRIMGEGLRQLASGPS